MLCREQRRSNVKGLLICKRQKVNAGPSSCLTGQIQMIFRELSIIIHALLPKNDRRK